MTIARWSRLEECFGMAYSRSMASKDLLRTPAVEDYCKAVFALEARSEDPVSTNALAERLGITPGSVSAMLRRLDELGLIAHVPAEAEVLEHVLSEDLEELIAAKLGNPTVDPHGDPIPSADLELEERPTHRMASLEPGDEGLFVRVSDSDPEMLRYLADRGIAPGERFAVRDRQPFGGPLFVIFGADEHAIGGELAGAMRVELDRSAPGVPAMQRSEADGHA